jgi:hypothetical protein
MHHEWIVLLTINEKFSDGFVWNVFNFAGKVFMPVLVMSVYSCSALKVGDEPVDDLTSLNFYSSLVGAS